MCWKMCIRDRYERLSRDDFGKDDDQQRESNSISNQKAMLEEFAARQGFTNIVHFTDDGISGTCFDRPGFLAMMKEVEAGNVEYLCTVSYTHLEQDELLTGALLRCIRSFCSGLYHILLRYRSNKQILYCRTNEKKPEAECFIGH